jgi:hypothetical protein
MNPFPHRLLSHLKGVCCPAQIAAKPWLMENLTYGQKLGPQDELPAEGYLLYLSGS